MIFRPDLTESDIKSQLETLSKELKLLDENELKLNATTDQKLQQNAVFLTQEKKEKLQKIKKRLDSEKEFYQLAHKNKYEETIKTRHLSQMQQSRFNSALQEKLQDLETAMDKKYQQFDRQIGEQINLSKQNYSAELQNKLDEERKQNTIRREKITNELRKLLVEQKPGSLESYKKELYDKIKEMDARIDESLKLINNNIDVICLDQYKKMDVYLFNTTNVLAQNYLLCNSNEIKIAIALRLTPMTDYCLDKALKLADKVVSSISAQLISKEKNKITFEALARDIEKELHLCKKENDFKEILTAIKEECINLSARTEYLFSSLYQAKKREYGNGLSSNASDNLIDQENARLYLQERALKYMLDHTDPKNFYLTFVHLGIEAMQAKIQDKKDQHSLNDFNLHHNQVIKDQCDALEETYNKFFIENKISPHVKEKLNHAEIKKLFFQIVTQGYMKHVPEPIYTLSDHLTTAEVLSELEEDFDKQIKIDCQQVNNAVQEKKEETAFARFNDDKSAHEADFFINLFQKEKLPQFEFFIKTKKPAYDVLKGIKSQLSKESGSGNYLKAIDATLQNSGFSCSDYGLFNKPASNELPISTPVISRTLSQGS